jgi:hypothetical protein
MSLTGAEGQLSGIVFEEGNALAADAASGASQMQFLH